MCLRLYRHYTECGCILATGASFRECRHGPTSPLCGPQHTIGIVTREGEECLYHACLTKKQRHAPKLSRKPRFRRPSGPGVTDKEVAVANLEHLRSLDMRERLARLKAKGLEGSYRGDPQPKPRGGALAFSRQFDGTEYTGQHPYENTDFEEDDLAQQKKRCRLRDDFLAVVQSEGLFDPSDQFLSSAWDDDSGLSAGSSEFDPDTEGAEPRASSEALNGGSGIVAGVDIVMEVDETDPDEAGWQKRDKEQGVDNYLVSENEGTLHREDTYEDLAGSRSNRASA
ncbi:hypothetical protein LZ30DRAFT_794723 [Colletotrichum cereale]|nr:hypothetical protein LZ30DRAFT_794723 [Colletotrichum cereale]